MHFEQKKLKEVDVIKDQIKSDTSVVYLDKDKLPSHYKSYPDNAEIYYHTYTYEQIMFLSESQLPQYQQTLLTLKGIETKNMNVLDLTYYDFLYIAFLRKLSMLDSFEYYFEYSCTCSKKKLKEVFKLEPTSVDFYEIKFDLPITLKLESGNKVFNPLTVGDYLYLLKNNLLLVELPNLEESFGLELQDNEDKIFINNDNSELAMMMEGDFKENYEFISKINNPTDISLLNSIIPLMNHGLKPYTFKCGKMLEDKKNKDKKTFKRCNIEHSVEFLGGELLIYPFHRDGNSSSARIIFGKKGDN